MKLSNREVLLEDICIVLYLILVFFIARHFFQYQLGGYDLSPLIDVSYRLQHGQKPGADFISTFPLSLLFWLKVNLLFFKNNWNFLFYSGFIHFVICTWFTCIVLKNSKVVEKAYIFLFALALSIPVLVTNHIWHNSFSLNNCIVLYTSLTSIILCRQIRKVDYLIFFLFGGLTIFSKQNIGLLCSILFGATIVFIYFKNFLPKRQIAALVLVYLSSVVFYGLLIYFFLGADVETFIKTYTSATSRALPSENQIKEVFINNKPNLLLTFALVISSAIIFFSLLKTLANSHPKKDWNIFIWFNICIQVVAYFSILTDWDTKFNNISLIIVSNLLVLTVINKQLLSKAYAAFVVLICFWGGYLGYMRYRMENVGYGSFFEKGKLFQIQNGYLDGLYCGLKLFKINNELVNLKKAGFLTSNTFFGPRMEFSYAQYNIPSPRHFPLWWHPGSSYGIKDEKRIIEEFKSLDFDVLVFLKADRTRIPGEILNYINNNYSISLNSQYLDIYSKR